MARAWPAGGWEGVVPLASAESLSSSRFTENFRDTDAFTACLSAASKPFQNKMEL